MEYLTKSTINSLRILDKKGKRKFTSAVKIIHCTNVELVSHRDTEHLIIYLLLSYVHAVSDELLTGSKFVNGTTLTARKFRRLTVQEFGPPKIEDEFSTGTVENLTGAGSLRIKFCAPSKESRYAK